MMILLLFIFFFLTFVCSEKIYSENKECEKQSKTKYAFYKTHEETYFLKDEEILTLGNYFFADKYCYSPIISSENFLCENVEGLTEIYENRCAYYYDKDDDLCYSKDIKCHPSIDSEKCKIYPNYKLQGDGITILCSLDALN